jgi:hypothetical protein
MQRTIAGFLGRIAPFFLVVSCSGDGEQDSNAAPAGAAGQTTGGSNGQAGSGGTQVGSGGAQVGSGGSAGAMTGPRGSSVSIDATRIQAQIIARSVAPGAEQHVCVTLELPNQTTMWVDKIHATLAGGSHHLIVDRRPQGTPLLLDPEACMPTTGADATRLMIAQQAETNITLPSGVAFALEPRQLLFMQLHYFNSGSAVRDVSGTLDLMLIDPSAPTPTEAKSIFTGSMDIALPPNAPGRAQAFFMPTQGTGNARHVFALTSHTHRLGVRSTIERVPNGDVPATTPIHESTNWDEPPLTMFDPPLAFNGSDGLRLICNYQNTTSQTVYFGTPVDAEMCFMWVYYFDR